MLAIRSYSKGSFFDWAPQEVKCWKNSNLIAGCYADLITGVLTMFLILNVFRLAVLL